MLLRFLVLGLFFFSSMGMSSDNTLPNDAGFTEAVFDAQTIQDLLDRRNCDGIRFYNSLSEGKVSLIAVAISEGADLRGSFFNRKPFAVSMGIVDNRISIEKVDEEQAKAMCQAIDQSTYAHYSTHFSKNDLQTLLSNTNCNALQIKPGRSSGNLSMEVQSVRFEDGRVSDLGEGQGFEMLAVDPCPPVCGYSGNYIYQAL